VKLTSDPHLVSRLRLRGAILHSFIRLQGVVLSEAKGQLYLYLTQKPYFIHPAESINGQDLHCILHGVNVKFSLGFWNRPVARRLLAHELM